MLSMAWQPHQTISIHTFNFDPSVTQMSTLNAHLKEVTDRVKDN